METKQKPLLPPDVERAIRERERERKVIEKEEPPKPDPRKQAPLLPPFFNPRER